MEIKDFFQAGLDRVKMATMRAVDGLTRHELMWRPGPEANSIGIVLFHAARSEDIFVQTRVQGKPEVWESDKWYQKLKMPVGEVGAHYTVEQLAAFPMPELKDLLGYAEAVRTRTVDYLKGMTPDKFDRVINAPRLGDVTIGAYLALMLVHLAEHAGDISYIRGLQRGLDK